MSTNELTGHIRPRFAVTLNRPRPFTVVCAVSGEVDLMTAPLLTEQLTNGVDGCREIVVDLSAVTFFAAIGVRVLDDVRGPPADRRRLVLVGAAPFVCKVLEICNASYPRYEALEDALKQGQVDEPA